MVFFMVSSEKASLRIVDFNDLEHTSGECGICLKKWKAPGSDPLLVSYEGAPPHLAPYHGACVAPWLLRNPVWPSTRQVIDIRSLDRLGEQWAREARNVM